MITSPVGTDTGSVFGRHIDRALVESDVEAVDHFVARLLRGAHQSAEARNAPTEARAILELAHMFADEWIASDPRFDRIAFVEAATEDPS